MRGGRNHVRNDLARDSTRACGKLEDKISCLPHHVNSWGNFKAQSSMGQRSIGMMTVFPVSRVKVSSWYPSERVLLHLCSNSLDVILFYCFANRNETDVHKNIRCVCPFSSMIMNTYVCTRVTRTYTHECVTNTHKSTPTSVSTHYLPHHLHTPHSPLTSPHAKQH